jgi:hypothetical protein
MRGPSTGMRGDAAFQRHGERKACRVNGGDAVHAVREVCCQRERDAAAHGMARHVGALNIHLVQKSCEQARVANPAVGPRRRSVLGAVAEPRQVRGDDPELGGKIPEHLQPLPVTYEEAVEQQQRRTVARLGHSDVYIADADVVLRKGCHGGTGYRLRTHWSMGPRTARRPPAPRSIRWRPWVASGELERDRTQQEATAGEGGSPPIADRLMRPFRTERTYPPSVHSCGVPSQPR